MDVELHRPHLRPRYFTVKVPHTHFGCIRIAVWGVRGGDRMPPRIVKSRWPLNLTRRVTPERPPAGATGGRGAVIGFC